MKQSPTYRKKIKSLGLPEIKKVHLASDKNLQFEKNDLPALQEPGDGRLNSQFMPRAQGNKGDPEQ